MKLHQRLCDMVELSLLEHYTSKSVLHALQLLKV